jgi:hypothetical protein
MRKPEEYIKKITFKMYVPVSELDYDISSSLGTQDYDYYYSPEQLYEYEGEDAECFEVEVELFTDLFAN